jgi:hypothetical protein
VTVADIDGDGKPDVIMADYSSGNISIYLNTSTNGALSTNSFAAPVTIGVGSEVDQVAVGDLDGDGKLDLVVADQSGVAHVLRNTSTPGAVSFAPAFSLLAGSDCRSVAVRDLDGDGRPDIIIASVGNSMVSVYPNLSSPGSFGAGSFGTRLDFATPSGALTVAVGDLNGDGEPDLVIGNGSSISVFRNTSTVGNIGFAPRWDLTLDSWGVAIGDVDGDGLADLAVANPDENTVTLLRNTTVVATNITFAPGVAFHTDVYPYWAAIGDMNGDGKPEVVTVNAGGDTVSIFANTSTPGSIGTNSLAAQVTFGVGGGPREGVLADLNGDGRLDIVTANLNSSFVSVLQNIIGNTAAPVINPQPTNQIVAPGGTSQFTVGINSLSPVKLQWQKNNFALSGQTNAILTLTNVQLSDFTNYSIIATNLYGATTSSNAFLVLDHPPVAGPDTIQRFASGGVKVSVENLLALDTDADGDPLIIINVSSNSAAGGTVYLNAGWIYYVPLAGDTNTDTFMYSVSDGYSGGTAVGMVTIQVRAVTSPYGIFNIQPIAGGLIQLNFDGIPNYTYRIQYTESLSNPNWQDLGTQTSDEFGNLQFMDNSGNAAVRYYRAVWP